MRFPFESEEAHNLNKEIFETIYYGALEASMELSKERGEKLNKHIDYLDDMTASKLAYKADDTYDHFLMDIERNTCKGAYHTFVGSPLSKGQFQFDLWNIKPSDRWEWDELRNSIIKYGVRNSLVTALMPTASTSQILGNNECFEPYTSNIYNRKTKAGEYKMVNKEMIIDLKYLNMWNDDIKSKIIKNYGSIQNIEGIPKEIKNIYKVVWEINQKCIVQQAIDRGPYVDQSQSMNIWMAEPNMNRLQKSHFYSWKNGLKTGMYYLRSKPAANAIQFTESNENECISCSG